MNNTQKAFHIVLMVLLCSAHSQVVSAHGREKTPPEFSVAKSGAPTVTFTDAHLKKMAKPFRERRSSFPDQVYVPFEELLGSIPYANEDAVLFEDYNGKRVKFPVTDILREGHELAVVSTNHGGWKLISLADAKKQTGAGSFYLRSIKTITLTPGSSTAAKGKGEERVYTDLKEALAERDKVYVLNLGGQNLETLPAEISQLKNLRELYLGRNRIAVLPPSVGELTQLEILNLGRNALTSLPPELGKLKNLKVLKLGRNQIQKLPKEIVKLEKLHNLDLDNNQLPEIEIFLSDMKNLEELGLASNRIQRVPLALRKITSLEKLDLEGNPILAEEKQKIRENFGQIEVIL